MHGLFPRALKASLKVKMLVVPLPDSAASQNVAQFGSQPSPRSSPSHSAPPDRGAGDVSAFQSLGSELDHG